MDKINGAGHVGRQFVTEDSGLNRPPTEITAEWLNGVQGELVAVIEGAGLVLSSLDNTQMRQAIVKMIQAGQRAVVIDAATFAGAVTGTGKAVYWDAANNRFDLALADGSIKQSAVGFADVPNAKVYCLGSAILFAGLTNGARYYLDTATAGAITTVKPAANVVFVGQAKSATELVVDIDEAPAIAQTTSSVRQTVLSGPTDANGYSAFGGATGGTTVTPAATLIVSAANGFGASGQVDQIGSITNPSWTGLNTNGVMYLYLDVAANGSCTPGATTLEPVYQFGGAYSTTNGQHTFNTQEMKMKVGNGGAATQVNRVFVGEVTVAGGVVTAITWYALMGRYRSQWTSCSTGLVTNSNDNLGVRQKNVKFFAKCVTAEFNYAVGDILQDHLNHNISAAYGVVPVADSRNTTKTIISGSYFAAVPDKSTGAVSALTAANWNQSILVERGW